MEIDNYPFYVLAYETYFISTGSAFIRIFNRCQANFQVERIE